MLGGGGPAGIAWEVGLAAGLAAEGADVRRAELILGTSAGAFVGAQLATGIAPQALADLHLALSRQRAKQGSPAAGPDMDELLAFMARLPQDAPPSPSVMVEMGRVALQSKTIPEAAFVALFAGMFGPTGAWPKRFTCSTVNAYDGRFKLWTGSDGVAIERAVAASCSVPGIYPPVAIEGSRWIDGGVRSWTNADCVAGHRRVIVVAVVLPETRALTSPVLARERAVIEAAKGTLALITPDAPSLEVLSEGLLAGRAEAIIEAGIAQGRREAARLGPAWG